MKRRIINLLLTALAVVFAAYLLPGITVDGYFTAIIVVITLTLLNAFIKPILTILTIPITIITIGLFLIVIDTFMVGMAGWLIDGFYVDGFWSALFFGIIVSVASFILTDKK